MSACMSLCDEAGAFGPNDVAALEASVDGHVESLNTAIDGCAAFNASDRAAWTGFYSSWQAEKKHWQDMLAVGWLVFAEFWDAGDTYAAMTGYAQQLPAWDKKVGAQCAGYQPPPLPPAPAQPPAPQDWTGAIKWGAAALILVIVASQVGLPRVFGAGGFLQSKRRARA